MTAAAGAGPASGGSRSALAGGSTPSRPWTVRPASETRAGPVGVDLRPESCRRPAVATANRSRRGGWPGGRVIGARTSDMWRIDAACADRSGAAPGPARCRRRAVLGHRLGSRHASTKTSSSAWTRRPRPARPAAPARPGRRRRRQRAGAPPDAAPRCAGEARCRRCRAGAGALGEDYLLGSGHERCSTSSGSEVRLSTSARPA